MPTTGLDCASVSVVPLAVGSISRNVPSFIPNATTGFPFGSCPNAADNTPVVNAALPCCDHVTQLPGMLPSALTRTTKPSLAQLITPIASSPVPAGSHASAVGGACDPSLVAIPPKVPVSCGADGLLTL